MSDSLQVLADAIAAGIETSDTKMLEAMRGIFGHRYGKRSVRDLDHPDRPAFIRNAYGKGGSATEHVAYAGFINPDNPSSGPYGGTSLVWFPTEEGCLIDFGIGTRGLSPDEGILTRPGHRRRIASLRRYLVSKGVSIAWARQDPATIGVPVPSLVTEKLPAWKSVFERYGKELYCLALVPKGDPAKARLVVQAFLDLYAYERGWERLKSVDNEITDFVARLNQDWFTTPTLDQIFSLLETRRFVILEGPPGTGKSRAAEKILKDQYAGNGLITQFHPSTTYEDFVAGLSPDIADMNLRFTARAGHLIEASKLAKDKPALLVIDEINRADLGRVLGEAIYLLESTADESRTVRLPQALDGQSSFTLPNNLHILATMNTADRSVSRMDLAIRRRFAFVTMMPDREVVKLHSSPQGLDLFDSLCDVFVEYAPDDALALLPGHSYFIVPQADEGALRTRLTYELLPLVDEYIREGYLGPATGVLHSVRDKIADVASGVV